MKYDLNSIKNITPDNMGGLCKLLFVPKEWIQTDAVLSIHDNKVLVPPVLIDGVNWLELVALQQTLGFQELQKKTSAGESFEQTLTGIFTAEYQSINTKVNLMSYHEFVVIYVAPNKDKKIIGNKKNGLNFVSDFTTGITASDRHAYNFSFNTVSDSRAPFYPV